MRGFTLIEALVAISILGMIGGLTYGVFARSVNARDRAEVITRRYHQIRQGMQRMANEISMAYLSYHKFCEEPRSETVFKGKHGGTSGRIDFTSFSHTKLKADANESDQNELSYFIDRDKDVTQLQNVVRREQAPIDDQPTEGGTEQVLIPNVKALSFQFYDEQNDNWEDEWDASSMDQRDRLPLFVAIKLVAENPNGKDETFVTKTRIFVRKPLLIMGSSFVKCMD